MTDHQPEFVRISQVQSIFGVSRATLYRAAQRNEITIHRRGPMSFISVKEMRHWITGSKNGNLHPE
ncbi:helix-turn-helix transcriptional regulator [Roseovarius sp. SYSU LYC5161]|uniref:helix-turn-helix transcriptional regulator n=1 Tax=Roseovarius halophilus (ex Wu et al. 2025) TaxID=3376060 RepID=UPI00399BA7F6